MRVAILIVLLTTACGPVEYIDHVTMRASSELEAAKAANAEKYAPYEYTEAVEFLHKAREEEGYADHQSAVRFGKKSEDMAHKAREKAEKAMGSEPSGEHPIDPSATPPAPEDHS